MIIHKLLTKATMHIYYYFPLKFHFNSGQTIQILRDYKYLSRLGYTLFLYGTFEKKEDLQQVKDYIGEDAIHLLSLRGSGRLCRNLLKIRFFWKMFCDRSEKWVLSRNYNKMKEILSWKRWLGKVRFGLEMHEDALPYMCKSSLNSHKMRSRFAQLFRKLDLLLLTNYSQEPIFKEQFVDLPFYTILPNGVEFDRFHTAERKEISNQSPIIITYTGQFTRWKNVELLFQALALLPKSYCLRIAGGKNDHASQLFIEELTKKYLLSGRIDFRGFVPPEKLISQVLSGSSVLALPLGDNAESKHFTSPLKLIEYMATTIPVVAVNYPSVYLLTGNDSVFLSHNDPDSFAEAIVKAAAYQDKERINTMNEIARTHSYENRSQRYHNVLRRFSALL